MTEQTLIIRENCYTLFSLEGERCVSWLVNEEKGIKAQWEETSKWKSSLYRNLPDRFDEILEGHKKALSTLREVDINTHDSLFFTYETEEMNYNPDDLNLDQPEIQPSGFIHIYQ